MSLMDQMELVEYSEKSCAVFGNTRDYKEAMKSLGGRFNMKLVRRTPINHDNGRQTIGHEENTEPGWIFPKSSQSNVLNYLKTGQINNSGSQGFGAQKSSGNLDEKIKKMEVKINNLESQVKILMEYISSSGSKDVPDVLGGVETMSVINTVDDTDEADDTDVQPRRLLRSFVKK